MKRRNSFFLAPTLLLAIFLSISGCSPAPKWLAGKWQGIGDQVDGQTWAIVLDATDLRSILINYPSLTCGGKWKVESKSKDEVVLRETLAYGQDKCDDNVEVHASKPVNGKMKIQYYIREISDDPLAHSELTIQK